MYLANSLTASILIPQNPLKSLYIRQHFPKSLRHIGSGAIARYVQNIGT
ncbi:hypothetical protein [Capnocytophaga haemolytica]|nr:hypothetical protein [Capnocytophaga haemolytica]